jgi:hypothetical protein
MSTTLKPCRQFSAFVQGLCASGQNMYGQNKSTKTLESEFFKKPGERSAELQIVIDLFNDHLKAAANTSSGSGGGGGGGASAPVAPVTPVPAAASAQPGSTDLVTTLLRLAEVQNQLRLAEQHINGLTVERNHNSGVYNDILAREAVLQAQIADLQAQIADLQAQLNDRNAEIATLRTQLAAAPTPVTFDLEAIAAKFPEMCQVDPNSLDGVVGAVACGKTLKGVVAAILKIAQRRKATLIVPVICSILGALGKPAARGDVLTILQDKSLFYEKTFTNRFGKVTSAYALVFKKPDRRPRIANTGAAAAVDTTAGSGGGGASADADPSVTVDPSMTSAQPYFNWGDDEPAATTTPNSDGDDSGGASAE